MKKFILIPVLIILYIYLINVVAYTDFSAVKENRKIIRIAKEFDFERFVEYVEENRIISFNRTVLSDYVDKFNVKLSEDDIDYIYDLIISSADLRDVGVEKISVQESAFVKVERPYFFGLLRLPVYTSYVGNIAWAHKLFFYFILALTILFVFLEFRSRKKRKKYK